MVRWHISRLWLPTIFEISIFSKPVGAYRIKINVFFHDLVINYIPLLKQILKKYFIWIRASQDSVLRWEDDLKVLVA